MGMKTDIASCKVVAEHVIGDNQLIVESPYLFGIIFPVTLIAYRLHDGKVTHFSVTSISGNSLAIEATNGYNDIDLHIGDQITEVNSWQTISNIQKIIKNILESTLGNNSNNTLINPTFSGTITFDVNSIANFFGETQGPTVNLMSDLGNFATIGTLLDLNYQPALIIVSADLPTDHIQPFNFVILDLTTESKNLLLPLGPPEATRCSAKIIRMTDGNTATYTAQSPDTINESIQSITLSTLGQYITLQYYAGKRTWYTLNSDIVDAD